MSLKNILCILVLLSSTAVLAKPHHPRGPSIDKLTETLALTEDQTIALEAIFEEHHQSMQALDRGAMEERKALKQDLDLQLQEVLSEEQFAQYSEMRKARGGKARHKKRRAALTSES